MSASPVRLIGAHVVLEPMSTDHADALFAIGRDPRIWEHLTRGPMVDVDDMRRWISIALAARREGSELPFVILDARTREVIGTTRYLEMSSAQRRLEIGYTWLAPSRWRSAVNTECKYMLLEHAFERLSCLRVQLKTDVLNQRSRNAIERIGGKLEGVLRSYQQTRGGRQRDSAMYSIIAAEWPELKVKLASTLAY